MLFMVYGFRVNNSGVTGYLLVRLITVNGRVIVAGLSAAANKDEYSEDKDRGDELAHVMPVYGCLIKSNR
jgi:hypothetical protein